MSISTTVRKAGPFAGNGVQTVFPFAFKVFQAADVVATRAQAGVETVLVLGADYTVALNADQDNAPGGNVTLTAALAVGQSLVLTSGVAALQGVNVTNGGGFFPAVFNGVFDRLTILVQQLAEQLGRTLKVQVTAVGVTSLDVPVLADSILRWNSTGTALTVQSLASLGISAALPTQAGHNGHALLSDGNNPFWGPVPADATKADKTLTISGGGLVTGGGDLSANRTLTVTAAVGADIRTGTDTSKATTAAALTNSAAVATLTYAATVTWDVAAQGYNATVTLGGNGVIGAPTNLKDGVTYSLELVQDGTGTRVPTWNAIWDWGAAGAPVLQTAAGKADKVFAQYNARTGKLDASFRKGA